MIHSPSRNDQRSQGQPGPLIANYLSVPSLGKFRRDLALCWTSKLELVVSEFSDLLFTGWMDPCSETGAWLRASILSVADENGWEVEDISPLDIATSHIRDVMARLAVAMDPVFANTCLSASCAEMLTSLIVRTAKNMWLECSGEIAMGHTPLLHEQSVDGVLLLQSPTPPGYQFLAVTRDTVLRPLGSSELSPDATARALVGRLDASSGQDPALIVVVCGQQLAPGISDQVMVPPS
jgi:hypothetical protein